jgi:hypothetical protein
MLCHLCKHDGTGSEACLSCRDTCNVPYNKGRTHVSLDSSAGNVVEASRAEMNHVLSTSRFDIRDFLPECCASTAERLIYLFTDLEEHHLCLVMAVLRGETLTHYAGRKNVSVPSVSQMLKRIVDAHPQLAFIREII